MTRRHRALAVIGGLVLAAWPLRVASTAQSTPPPQSSPPASSAQTQPPPIFRTGVGSVLVDVTVTGRDNAPVGDLKPDDFEVVEDGEPQSLDMAQFVRLDGTTRADGDSLEIRSQEHARAEAARDDVRLFAVFMDDYSLDRAPANMIPLRKGLADFFKTMLGPTDLLTVMDPLTPLSALQWTRNRLELADQLHKYEGRADNFQPRSVIEEGHLRTRNVRLVRAEVTISAMSALVAHLGALREGRKSVLFVSHGIPLYFPGISLEHEFQELIRLANRSNVVIHVLDPRGVQLGLGNSTLVQLAGETGGRPIVNANDLGPKLADVVQDASAYYLLGYTPAHERADGKFHKIQVKVKRPGVRVVARRGYWAPKPDEMTPDTTAPAIDPAVAAALDRLKLEETDRLVKVWTGFTRAADGHAVLTVAWEPSSAPEIDRTIGARGDLLPLDASASGGPRAPATVLRVKVLDDAGRVLVEAESAADPARRTPGMSTLDLTRSAAKLQYSAETAVGDVVDRWERRITVPDYSASGLVIGAPQFLRARTRVELQELRRGAPSVPTAEHNFRSSDLVIVRVTVQGTGEEPLEIAAELQSRQGQRLLVLTFAEPADASGARAFELPLRSLALGQYVVRVTARQRDEEASQSSAFAIVR